MRLLYIVSMRDKAHSGLHSFIFREIDGLRALGFDIILFPIKWGRGPYMPKPDWKVVHPRLAVLLWAVVTLSARSPAVFVSQLRVAIRTRTLPAFLLGALAAYIVTRDSCDGIHAHFGDHKLYTGYYAKTLTGRSLSTTIHAYELYSNPRPQLFRQALAACNGIVTISDFNKDQLAKLHGVDPGDVEVVRLWVDVPSRLNRIHRQPASESTFTVVTVGRFVEKKGYRTLLRAMADPRLDSTRLIVVGRGPLDVLSVARELGIENRMTVHPYVTDDGLKRLYEESDTFCLPSQTESQADGTVLDREGIPVSIMEAMVHGMPVVATRHAGIPELVEKILVREGDAAALSSALVSLKESPALRHELGCLNLKIAHEKCGRNNLVALSRILIRAHQPNALKEGGATRFFFPDSRSPLRRQDGE